MSWLDILKQRSEQARQRRAEPAPPTRPVTDVTLVTRLQPHRGEARPRPKLETVWIQTRVPNEYDPGAIELGYYTVEGGVLTMREENGKATGAKQTLSEGDDPKVIAQRLRREAWHKAMGEGNFNRPLNYQKVGVA